LLQESDSPQPVRSPCEIVAAGVRFSAASENPAG